MTRYNPRLERSLKRRSSYRDIKQSFLIICEGVNTEPDYFNAFRLTSASVKALGKGLKSMDYCCHISKKPYQEQERFWQNLAIHRHRKQYLQQQYSNLLKS